MNSDLFVRNEMFVSAALFPIFFFLRGLFEAAFPRDGDGVELLLYPPSACSDELLKTRLLDFCSAKKNVLFVLNVKLLFGSGNRTCWSQKLKFLLLIPI